MGKTKFLESWLSREDGAGHKVKEWCTKGSDNDSSFYCKVCKKTLSCQKGFQALLQHAAAQDHKKNASVMLNQRQLRLAASAPTGNHPNSQSGDSVPQKNLEMLCKRDAASRVEIV